jgi:hypothetical protein
VAAKVPLIKFEPQLKRLVSNSLTKTAEGRGYAYADRERGQQRGNDSRDIGYLGKDESEITPPERA